MVYAAGAARQMRLHFAIFLGRLTSVLVLVGGVFAGLIAILYAWGFVILAQGSDPTAVDSLATMFDAVGGLGLWALELAAGSYLLWLYRTVRSASKLLAAGAVMSPAAALFFALVLLPHGVIKDLHAGLAHDDRSLGGHLISVWWIAWVATFVLMGILGWLLGLDRTAGPDRQLLAGLSVLFGLLFMMTAGLTAWTVRVISDGERRTARLADEGKRSPQDPPAPTFVWSWLGVSVSRNRGTVLTRVLRADWMTEQRFRLVVVLLLGLILLALLRPWEAFDAPGDATIQPYRTATSPAPHCQTGRFGHTYCN